MTKIKKKINQIMKCFYKDCNEDIKIDTPNKKFCKKHSEIRTRERALAWYKKNNKKDI